MSNPNLEVCHLRELYKKERRFLGFYEKWTRQWIAEMATASGSVVIAKSEEWVTTGGSSYAEVEQKLSSLYSELLQNLLADGWEPAGTDNEGRIMALKRIKTPAGKNMGVDYIELLKQLESLLRAEILTQEEFNKKKAEILKRI